MLQSAYLTNSSLPPNLRWCAFGILNGDCVYDEAKVVLSLGFDIRNASISRWPSTGIGAIPRKNGLAKGALLLRRHHDPLLRRTMETWTDQILCHARRGQLSMLPSCWFENLDIEYIPHKFDAFELLDWPIVIDNLRVPRDFDEARYLELNPDLANLDIDLRKHYLLSGLKENRKYRNLDLATSSPLQILRRIKHRLVPRKF